MARPIKETPILFGEEAREFERRANNPVEFSEERKKKIREDHEFMRNRGINCSF